MTTFKLLFFYNFQRHKLFFLRFLDFKSLHIHSLSFFVMITDNLLFNSLCPFVYFIIDFMLRYLWMLSSLLLYYQYLNCSGTSLRLFGELLNFPLKENPYFIKVGNRLYICTYITEN